MNVGIIVSLSPMSQCRDEIALHPAIKAFRFNTIEPIKANNKKTALEELVRVAGNRPLYIDLKARQLRVAEWTSFSGIGYVQLNHRISVNLPTTIHFRDFSATVIEIQNGNTLVLEEKPTENPKDDDRVLAKGRAVNILDPSLKVEGFLTIDDIEYVEAARSLGLHDYMVSFVECLDDITSVLDLDPEAKIIAKIESKKGLDFVKGYSSSTKLRLMTARDDLFVQMGENKVDILEAEKLIITSDAEAIMASRILTSLQKGQASLGDIKDVESILNQGYRHLMLSDGICRNGKAFNQAMTVLQRIFNYLGL